eukprot:3044618-Pyramimonas_sp.AAC.1
MASLAWHRPQRRHRRTLSRSRCAVHAPRCGHGPSRSPSASGPCRFDVEHAPLTLARLGSCRSCPSLEPMRPATIVSAGCTTFTGCSRGRATGGRQG